MLIVLICMPQGVYPFVPNSSCQSNISTKRLTRTLSFVVCQIAITPRVITFCWLLLLLYVSSEWLKSAKASFEVASVARLAWCARFTCQKWWKCAERCLKWNHFYGEMSVTSNTVMLSHPIKSSDGARLSCRASKLRTREERVDLTLGWRVARQAAQYWLTI